MTGEFSNSLINQEQDDGTENAEEYAENEISSHKIIELKGNFIPKGLVTLERIFSKDDTSLKPAMWTSEENVMDCNISTKEHLRIVKISKALSVEQRERYIKLLKEYVDIFAWSYEDLKTYDTSIIQHKVPLKPNVKPFRQKLRRINPALFPVIEKEVKKLLDAKIIVPLKYSSWVENLVPVKKKNGEIRLCVDFHNLNRSSLKDNYPLLN